MAMGALFFTMLLGLALCFANVPVPTARFPPGSRSGTKLLLCWGQWARWPKVTLPGYTKVGIVDQREAACASNLPSSTRGSP